MKNFLTYLVYKLKTVDGNKNSALPVIKALSKQSTTDYLKKIGKVSLNENRERKINARSEYLIYKKVLLKYKIMIVRSKISYQALINRMTILELFCTQILSSYNKFVEQGHIIDNNSS